MIRRLGRASLLLAALISCRPEVVVAPTEVEAVAVAVTSPTIISGNTTQATATAVDTRGRAVTEAARTWTTSSASIATVDANGVVTGVAAGTAIISASVLGVTGATTVTVQPRVIRAATVTVTSAVTSLVRGGTAQMVATMRDSAGVVLSGRTVTWTSSDPSVATVSSSGLVTGTGVGSATITATSDGVFGTLALTVVTDVNRVILSLESFTLVGPGKTQQLTAEPRNASGTALSGRTVTWSSSDVAVATVTSTGLVTSVAVGTATIRATVDGVVGNASVTVTSMPVASVWVSPSAATVVVGGTRLLMAETRDANGVVLAGRTVTWSSSDSAVATVSSTGLVTATAYTGAATRTATITATSEGKAGTSAITVTPSPVVTVGVSPASATLVVGGTQQLSATPRDTSGTAVTGRTVTWSSSDLAVATVSSTGLVTATAYTGAATRTATITATSEGKAGTSAITVTPSPVVTVGVSPASATLVVGGTQQLSATPRDTSGAALSGRTVTWSSSDVAVATVTSTGLVTGVGAGSVTITATSEGRSGTASITVQLVPVASVTISPTSASLTVGATQTLTATTRDAFGAVLTGRSVTWTSSNTAVATVSTSGVVTAAAAGSATITATSEGRSGTASITVQLVPVASVTISPTSASLTVGATQTLTATTRDVGGALLTGRTVTWASSNAAVASVSTSGVVTAVAVGTATITATSEGRSGTATITVPCSTANPPSAGQSLCVATSYNVPAATSGTTLEYLLSRATTTNFVVTLSGGTGDADMIIVNPAGSVVCSTTTLGNNDSCSLTGAVGTWRIRVYAYSTHSGVTLRIQ